MYLQKLLLIIFVINFIFSGLIINFIQLLNFITIGQINKYLYYKINGHLYYSLLSQLVVWFQFTGSKIRIFFADSPSKEWHGKEKAICIGNHSYEIDWIVHYAHSCYADLLRLLRSLAKNSIKYVPTAGMCAYFTNHLFLDRNWEKDKHSIGPVIDDYLEYEGPIQMLLYCEGTRFTQEKYEQCVRYAKEKGLDTFKYHLYPRTRGFVHIIQHLKRRGKKMGILNFQLAFNPNLNIGRNPTLSTLLEGQPLVCDLYCKRYDMDHIDCTNDETMSKFCLDLYHEKDQLVENHKKTGKFPGTMAIHSYRLLPVINWFIWVAVLANCICILYVKYGNHFTILLIALGLLGAYRGFTLIAAKSTITSGSKYGRETTRFQNNNY